MVKKTEVAQALSYRLGSFLLASLIAWGILSYLRGTSWSNAGISFFTSGVLQITHTGYYILFHRWWKRRDPRYEPNPRYREIDGCA